MTLGAGDAKSRAGVGWVGLYAIKTVRADPQLGAGAGAGPEAPTRALKQTRALLAGGSVLSTRCSETYETKTALVSLFGVPLWYFSQSPRVVIQVGRLAARTAPSRRLRGRPAPRGLWRGHGAG